MSSTEYGTGNESIDSWAVSCPSGYVAIGGGGYSNGGDHSGESAPVDAITLNAAITTGAHTSITVLALPFAVASGDWLAIGSPNGTTTNVHVSANAAVGATTISFTSVTFSTTYAVGTPIADGTSEMNPSNTSTTGNGQMSGQPTGWYYEDGETSNVTAYVSARINVAHVKSTPGGH